MSEHTPAPNPTRGVYGFAVFLLFKSLFIIYVFWAFMPQSFLEEKLGLTYMPDKYFALYIPVLILTGTTLFAFFIYPSMGLALTTNIDDIRTIRDQFSIVRCQHGVCDMKIESTSLNLCPVHLHTTTNNVGNKETKVPSVQKDTLPHSNLKIEKYCDCIDKEKCLLSNENFNYLNEIENRKHVPTVSDLDIVDVCRKLYLNE